MATRQVRAADRRAWYAWKLARRLNAASIHSVAWPPPEEDWSRKVYLGHGPRPESSRSGMVVVFEPDQPLDVDATWSALLLLPDCCRNPRQSGSIDIDLDAVEPDGTVDPQHGRGALLPEAVVRIGQAWTDHHTHSIDTRTERAPHSVHPTLVVAPPNDRDGRHGGGHGSGGDEQGNHGGHHVVRHPTLIAAGAGV